MNWRIDELFGFDFYLVTNIGYRVVIIIEKRNAGINPCRMWIWFGLGLGDKVARIRNRVHFVGGSGQWVAGGAHRIAGFRGSR